MESHSTNPTDKQWQFVEKIVNTQEKNKNIHSAILFIESSSCSKQGVNDVCSLLILLLGKSTTTIPEMGKGRSNR